MTITIAMIEKSPSDHMYCCACLTISRLIPSVIASSRSVLCKKREARDLPEAS